MMRQLTVLDLLKKCIWTEAPQRFRCTNKCSQLDMLLIMWVSCNMATIKTDVAIGRVGEYCITETLVNLHPS